MKMKTKSLSRHLVVTLFVLLCICPWACTNKAPANGKKNYQIIHKVIPQPVDHTNPDGPTLPQQIDILIPEGVPADSPVFFNLGNESDLTEDFLVKLHELHGDETPIIYIQAEHRGYGQSLTRDEDQSVPSYVRIDQALADAHKAIQQLKEDYPGPWMAAGWSYGGGLVINFAAKYPDDIEVILVSSGVVDWPFLNYEYDRQVRITMGEACYKRLAKHAANLEPKELFDRNWQERELLYAFVAGMTQMEDFRKFLPYFKLSSFLPTVTFLKVLHLSDKKYGDGEAWWYAQSLRKKTLTRAEAATGKYGWRVWRYQQCTQAGVFFASENGGLYAQTREDFCNECSGLFGEPPAYATDPGWYPREMIETLTVPVVYVSGGMDPWLALCLEPDHEISNGKYFYLPEARHCPDRHDPELSREVLTAMLEYVESE